MCGIVGVLDPRRRRDEPELAALVAAMADRMVARGPDGAGTWVEPATGIAFGHRRLSILDLSEAGAQPMISADGRWVLTYNGEIYDHVELGRRLDRAGVQRRGHSDSEMLVEAVARWGLDATLEHIDGMWAFALWDRADRQLHLVRDRMGEKPLFVATTRSGEVVFASSLDAIRAHPSFDPTLDLDALALYFRHKYVPAPHSIYRAASKVPAGAIVAIDATGARREPRQYWTLPSPTDAGRLFAGSAQHAVDELDALLRRSVRERMVADVPVGAFLSGGIDSSAVVAAAQAESSGPVRTFTIGSDDPAYDEAEPARRVASLLGTEHTELRVSGTDALGVVDRLPVIYDEPFADSSQIPARLVSELARTSVTVALTGDGGDELFGGYDRYRWAPRIWNRVRRVPLGGRRIVANGARRVPAGWWDRSVLVVPERRRPRQLGVKAAKAVAVLDAPTSQEVFRRLCTHWPEPERLVIGACEPPTRHSDPSGWSPGPFAAEMAAVDTVTYLPDDILAKVDRAAMSVSLEGRVPLLARSIVEFSASLPWEWKVRDGTSKWLLRQLVARSVPNELIDRPKAGFGVPIASWLRGPLRTWAEDLILDPGLDGLLDPALRRAAWREHQAGTINHAYRLWDVAQFASWRASRTSD